MPLGTKREPGEKFIDALPCSSHQFAENIAISPQFLIALRVHRTLSGGRPEFLSDSPAFLTLGGLAHTLTELYSQTLG